jgi:hypothetical protein
LARAGLVAYYRMGDGSGALTDSSANADNATVAGTVTYGSTALLAGDAATSISFNGSTGHATPAGSTPLTFHSTDKFSIEAIVVVPSNSGENMILTKMQGAGVGNVTGYAFEINTKKLMAQLQPSFPSDRIACLSGTTLTSGTTHHVAMTYDGSKTGAGLLIYLDGFLDTTCTGSISGDIAFAVNADIGARGGGHDSFFSGNIQELAVYSRVLDPVEINIDGFGVANKYLKPDLAFPINVIYDEDPGADSDDAGSLGALLQLQHRGQVRILALTTVGNIDYGAAATSATARYYGYPSIPIGPYMGSTGATDAYASQVATDFGYHHPRTDAAFFPNNAVATLVNALCAQGDDDTDIIEGGQLTNLDARLNLGTTSCGGNSYTGSQIISHKVHRFYIVSGIWPSGNEFNIDQDKSAAADFLANVPAETVMVGIELGNALGSAEPPNPPGPLVNPVLDAYTVSSLPGPRPLWSEIGTVGAAEGLTRLGATPGDTAGGSGGYLIAGGIGGTAAVNISTGGDSWSNAAGNISYMKFASAARASSMQTYMTSLLTPVISACAPMIGGGACGVIGENDGVLEMRAGAPQVTSR